MQDFGPRGEFDCRVFGFLGAKRSKRRRRHRFGKFLKNLQNFLKRRLRRRFGRFAPENPKTLPSKPLLGQKSGIRPPPQGVRDPIISSAWTSKRARTGSYASLLRGVTPPPKSLWWVHAFRARVYLIPGMPVILSGGSVLSENF